MFNTQAITFELIFIASTNELHTLTPNKFYFITNNVDVFSEKNDLFPTGIFFFHQKPHQIPPYKRKQKKYTAIEPT